VVPLVFESKFLGHGAMEAWTINGKSYPDARAPPRQGPALSSAIHQQKWSTIILFIYTVIVFELRTLGVPLTGDPRVAPEEIRGIMKDVPVGGGSDEGGSRIHG